MVNWHDPYERAAFLEENDRQKAELERSIAERQARGPVPTWQPPQPELRHEPASPQRQAFMTREAQQGWDEWIKAHIARSEHKTFHAVAKTLAEIANDMKAKQEKRLEALAEAMGETIGQEHKTMRGELAALREQVAEVKRELELLGDERVIDARGLLKGSRDVA